MPSGKMCGERALLLLEPGHVGVAEKRDAVGLQLQDLIDRVAEALRRLIRQAVDQVHVDAVEFQARAPPSKVARQFERLNAVDGRLHFGMEILNAHAEAIEAQAREGFRDAPRVVTRGSISMPISASGEKRKCARVNPNRSAICSGVR